MSAIQQNNGTGPLIRATELRKVFPAPRGTRGEDVVAVDGVTFELRPDECLAIVGESGSGKTTVARMLVGLETVTDGTVEINGVDRTAAPRSLRDRRARAREVQYVFQDPYSSLNGRQRIGEVIVSNLRIHGRGAVMRAHRRRRSWTRSASRNGSSTVTRRSSPVVSGSAWQLHALLPQIPA